MAKVKHDKIKEFSSDEGLILLEGWSRDGLSMGQIASNIGISRATLYQWIDKNEKIKNALKKGRDVADYEVENALFKSATGFYYEEEVLDAKGKKHTIKRYSKPNVVADMYWTKNRRPDKWRDKREQEITGSIPVVIKDDLSDYDDE